MKYTPETSRVNSRAVTLNFRFNEADESAARVSLVAEQKAAEARAAAIPEVAQIAELRSSLDEMQKDMQQTRDDIANLQRILEEGTDEAGTMTDAALSLGLYQESLATVQKQYADLVKSTCVVFDRAAAKLSAMRTAECQRLVESHRAVRDKRQTELLSQIEALVTQLAATAGNYGQALSFNPFTISALIGERPTVPNFSDAAPPSARAEQFQPVRTSA